MRDELRLAMEAAREAGLLMLQHYGGEYDVRDKTSGRAGRAEGADLRAADYDPVTSADMEADACLREGEAPAWWLT